MGFDKHFHQDHCYLEDPDDSVGMNVEISQMVIGDGYQVVYIEHNEPNKHGIRDLDNSGSSGSKTIDGFEDDNQSLKQALVYLPYPEVCTEHEDLFLHEDEKLVKPGDKFSSHKEFIKYLNENAKRWCFYYKCSDSRNPNTEYETYTYNCVYLRNKEKYKKKGLRQRNNNSKTDCPCKIKLRHLPNEKELTVVYVCNHHDHELSLEEFYKLQHGRRLPAHIKEEIMDFLALKVDIMKIRAYVQMETGFTMSRPFFYALEKNMKSKNIERQITDERLAFLTEKIAAVGEVYGYKNNGNADDQAEISQDTVDSSEVIKKMKQKQFTNGAERTRMTSQLKRRIKYEEADEASSPDISKRIKLEAPTEDTYNTETYQSVQDLQESVKCEIQTNPWVPDQCVPVLPNRTATKTEPDESVHIQSIEQIPEVDTNAQNEEGGFTYTIQYYNPNDNSIHEIISNEFGEIISEEQIMVNQEDNVDNIVYETVANEDNNGDQCEEQQVQECENNDSVVNETFENQADTHGEVVNESENLTEEYVNSDSIANESVENHNDTHDEVVNQSETLNEDLVNTQEISQSENHVQYEVDGNESTIEYEDNNAQEVGVQTANSSGTAHSLLPVFDVYMKDGNVTGFVVNDSVIGGLKDCTDKEIQTSEDIILSDLDEIENEEIDGTIIHDVSKSTYTRHEYVHKYNIDKYMVQPHFPKYIQTLAKETNMDILSMFTNIYNEKGMFKLTTTQTGKEGNTRIWYVKDVRLKRKRKEDETLKERLGKNLQSVFILKEKLRMLRRENRQLDSKNKQLEDLALRLVNLE